LFDAIGAQVLDVVSRTTVDALRSEEATEAIFLAIWKQSPRFDPGRTRALEWIASVITDQLEALRSGGDDATADSVDARHRAVAQ
jgi:DNA-directed RNA polymerase specialized sigma24 family protein